MNNYGNNFYPTDPSNPFSTLTNEQLAKFKQQKDYWQFYNGLYRKNLASKVLPNGNIIDDNVSINLAKRVIDKGNNFLFGKGIEWQLDEVANSEAIENSLYNIWGNQEKLNSFLPELGINGGITGDYYIQIVKHPTKGIRVKNLDPTYVFPTPDPYDDDEALEYEMRWHIGNDWYRLIHKPQDDKSWVFYKEKWNGKRWAQISPTEIWPYSWPFISHGKNLPNPNSYYGQSDLVDITLVDPLNSVASNLNRIIRIFAHPMVWSKGMGDLKQLDVDGILNTTNKDANLAALELGRDLTSAQEFMKFLRSLIAEITNVPESDPERLKIGASSGFALQVLLNDLILKTGIKQATYGKTLIECNRRLLELDGHGDNNIIKLHWPNPLPTDILAQTTSDQFDLSSGLASKKTISTNRGYDYDVEVDQMKKERTEKGNIGEALLSAFDQGKTNFSSTGV